MTEQKIMIVDDDKEFLAELGEILTLSGYDLIPCGDATLVTDMAVKVKPDVILLDLKMPGKSGFEVAYEIRNLCELEKIPIIAMSAYFKDEYTLLMDICGIKKCLKKPFNPLDLISEIENALRRNNQ